MSERIENTQPRKNGIANIKEYEIDDYYKKCIEDFWNELENNSNIKDFNITEDQKAIIRNKIIKIIDKSMYINDLQLHLTIRKCLKFEKCQIEKILKKINVTNTERNALAENLVEFIIKICK